MTQSATGSPNPFDVIRRPEPGDSRRQTARTPRISLPLQMDDGQLRTVELPAVLEQPSRFSAAEFERLARAYAEVLGLIEPKL